MSFRIAERWFERERVEDGITRLWEPYVIRLEQCNIWHVRGRDRDLFIDTGMGIASLSSAARDLLERPVTAVATHTHVDHVGSLHEFEHRIVHRAEAALLDESERFSLLREDHPAALIEAFETAGYEVGECFVTALPSGDFELRRFARPPAPATRVVEEGDRVDLGDRAFEILHLPGHSPGSIGLWEPATATLFSGDAIYDGPLLDRIPGADLEAYVATMRRLESLPARIVHAGHDPSFDGARLRALARAFLERHGAG